MYYFFINLHGVQVAQARNSANVAADLRASFRMHHFPQEVYSLIDRG
jgi:hypothetical protein